MVNATDYDRVYRDEIIGQPKAMHLIVGWSLLAAAEVDGKTVLDLGCGLGILANVLQEEQIPVDRYVGVDFCEVALAYARQHAPLMAEFIQADVMEYAVGKAERTFDTVTLVEVLEHILHPADLVREAKRIADKRVVVTVPMHSPNPLHVKDRWTPDDLQRLLGPCRVRKARGWWVAVWDRAGRVGSLREIAARPRPCCD